MRYYVGDEARLRGAVEKWAMSVFDGWSYEELSTPSVDYYDLFEQGMGRKRIELFGLQTMMAACWLFGPT